MSAYVEVTAPGSVRDPSEESLGGTTEIVSYHRVTVRAGVPLTITLLASDLIPKAFGFRVRLTTLNNPPVPEFLPYDDISPISPDYFNSDFGGGPVPWSPGVLPYIDGNSYFDDTLTDLLTYATFTPVIGPAGENVYFATLSSESDGVTFDPVVVATLRVEVIPARVAPLRQRQRDDRTRRGSSKQSSVRQGWKGTYL